MIVTMVFLSNFLLSQYSRDICIIYIYISSKIPGFTAEEEVEKVRIKKEKKGGNEGQNRIEEKGR